MKHLVLTHRHELLPLAHRLRREGHDTEVVVWHRKYEGAWSGKIRPALHGGEVTAEHLKSVIDAAALGEVVVTTNVVKAAPWFEMTRWLYPVLGDLGLPKPADRILIGGWFDGEAVTCPHWCVADWGPWPHGLGCSRTLGALTLIRHDGPVPKFLDEALRRVTEALKVHSFKGLFHFDVVEDPSTGDMRLNGLSAGWPFLHTHAFLAELGVPLGSLLTGTPPVLSQRFVVVLPVSVPPWPNPRSREGTPPTVVEGLTPIQTGRMFWHDITVDAGTRTVRTGGLDGLVGVATGSAHTFTLARARALELAGRMSVPSKQYRVDAGDLVTAVLATLEERFGVSVG